MHERNHSADYIMVGLFIHIQTICDGFLGYCSFVLFPLFPEISDQCEGLSLLIPCIWDRISNTCNPAFFDIFNRGLDANILQLYLIWIEDFYR